MTNLVQNYRIHVVHALADEMPTDAVTVSGLLALLSRKPSRRMKLHTKLKGPYLYLTDAQRYEVGKKAAAVGTTDALRYFAHRYPIIFDRQSPQ